VPLEYGSLGNARFGRVGDPYLSRLSFLCYFGAAPLLEESQQIEILMQRSDLTAFDGDHLRRPVHYKCLRER